MDEEERVQYLIGLLDFRNMPKAVKKRALFEASRILGIRFTEEELESIERKFTIMDIEHDSILTCAFCLKPIALGGKLRRAKFSLALGAAYWRHLEDCRPLRRLILRHHSSDADPRTRQQRDHERR